MLNTYGGVGGDDDLPRIEEVDQSGGGHHEIHDVKLKAHREITAGAMFGAEITQLSDDGDLDVHYKNNYEADMPLNKQSFLELYERLRESTTGSKWDVKLNEPNL